MKIGNARVWCWIALVSLVGLSLSMYASTAAADTEIYGDYSDAPDDAFSIESISYGHQGKKLIHYVFTSTTAKVKDFQSFEGTKGLTYHFSINGEVFFSKSKKVYWISLVKDPGWFKDTKLIGEVFRGDKGFIAKRVPAYISGNLIKIRMKRSVLNSPDQYYYAASSRDEEADGSDCDLELAGYCVDYAAFDEIDFVHEL